MGNDDTGSPVTVREESVVIPTYSPAAPNPNPMFLEKRVNQGSSGRVYPNPLRGQLSDEKVDRSYQAVTIENEYVQLMILPEIGGRIHAGVDKTNGYDFIYRQHVIKPALIGLFGPWVSGGVEFNWPQHHRPSTFMTVDHMVEKHADGSRTVWLSEHDPMARMKGMVGICLRPGRSVVEFKVRLYNRTPFVQTFLWWVNFAVHTNEHYQVFFSPDVRGVTDHSRRAMSRFPVARGVYYGIDYAGVDISWYKNLRASASYFALDPQQDFFGGYDHGRRAGVINVANHHISPGRKLFTWGSSSYATRWERNLTDGDGPYVELMAGVYTDNQPDFSWLQPFETRAFSQYWYPFREIGPARNANLDAAVNLEVDGGAARVGVCSTATFYGTTVRLTRDDEVLLERKSILTPGSPFIAEVDLPGDAAAEELEVSVLSAEGDELIRYAPQEPGEEPLPDPATPPPPPGEIETTEELYLTGLHLEQYRHPTIDPEPYWREALRRDPGDVRSNNAMGLLHLHRGSYSQAEDHFRQALARLTRRNFNPRDGEPAYNLGLTLRFQGRLDEAYAAFYKATWNHAWRSAAFLALAEIDCRRSDWYTALDHLERSLLTDAHNLKARNLKAAALRRAGRLDEAKALARETKALDPLDFWSRNEFALACQSQGRELAAEKELRTLRNLVRGETQTALDIAFDYADAGLWREADEILDGMLGHEGDPYPMVLYARGTFAHRRGGTGDAEELYRRASQAPPGFCFPVRLQEAEILTHVLEVNPGDARAHYYLGNLLYDKRRYEEAIEHWEACCQLDGSFAIPWRNLGIAYYNARGDREKAHECYQKAVEMNPRDAYLLYELDQLEKRLQSPPAGRLARLEEHPELVAQHDDLASEQVTLYNQLGRHQDALDALLSRRFHPWEGGSFRIAFQYISAHFFLGRAALESGDPQEALRHCEAAQTFPETLGTGRHPVFTLDAHVDYLAGLAREALGDDEEARACYERATREQRRFSFATYYQALALKKLGQEAEARERLEALFDHASEQLRIVGETGFATSIPTFSVFKDDPGVRNRANYGYLIGLAQLGLDKTAEARSAFEEVLALDANHLGAKYELERLV